MWAEMKPSYKPRKIQPAPQRLVSHGKFSFGTFSSQFQRVNLLEAPRAFAIPLPRPLLSFRLKEWQAFQLGNQRYFMLVVLYNAKVSALTQFIVYDKQEKKRYHFERMLPSWEVKVPGSLWEGQQRYGKDGCLIELISQLKQGRFYINVEVRSQKGLPDMVGHFEAFHDEGLVEPIVVSIPFNKNRGVYSHKCLMPMQGSLSIGDEKIEFLRQESFAIIDDHKGFYPYVMKYDWVTGAGFDKKGQLTGFNLTDNQSLAPEKYNENCLWLNGKLHLLPPVKFQRPKGVEGDWVIRDQYGMVDLVFRPVSMGKIDMNFLLLKVKYRGPFGYCNGFVKNSSGHRVEIKDYFGMGEDKYVRG
ncbi:MAG: DUF2804 domain-containing protein [Chloroflexi bacterium]|nr:DUF2804 domain-containing protein [Chloroflexota bacterium]